MILYHGTSLEIKEPHLKYSREDIDFGKGFYLTPDIMMAKKWACAKANAVVNVYDVDIEKLNTYQFSLNEEWLCYIKDNRTGDGNPHYDQYDLLIGPTADDKLFTTIQEYLDGLISEQQAVEYLNIAGFSNQYVIKNESSLNEFCVFVNSTVIEGEEKQKVREITKNERIEALQKLELAKKQKVQSEQVKRTYKRGYSHGK